MTKPDIREGQPRQQHGGEKEDRGDKFGRTRACGWRLERLRLAGRGIESGMRALRGRCAARMAVVDGAVRVILRADMRGAAGITGACASERDESRDDGAEERQENDRVKHPALSPSSG